MNFSSPVARIAFGQIVDQSSDVMGIISLDHRFEALNHKAKLVTGYAIRKEVPSLSEILAPESLTGVLDGLKEVALSKGHWVGRLDFVDQTAGTRTRVHARIFPIVADSSEAVVGFSFIGTDESDRELLLREIETRDRLIEDAGRLMILGQISGLVVHEINNPMTVITGKAEKIISLSKHPVPDLMSLVDCGEKILRMAERTEKIIRSVKTLSHKPTTKLVQLVSLHALVDDVRDLIEVGSRRFDVEVRIPEISEELVVRVDPIKLSQVFVNLISNSYDAIANLDERWVEMMVERDPQWLTIRIVDSGAGIGPDVEKRLFEGFFTTKQAGQGSGIGLNLSRRMIRGFGGDLFLDKTYRNTAFAIRLPRIDSAEHGNAEEWEEI